MPKSMEHRLTAVSLFQRLIAAPWRAARIPRPYVIVEEVPDPWAGTTGAVFGRLLRDRLRFDVRPLPEIKGLPTAAPSLRSVFGRATH